MLSECVKCRDLCERTDTVALQFQLRQKGDLPSQMMGNDELSTGLRLP